MRKKHMKTTIRLLLTLLCILSLSLSAWAAEDEAETASGQSRVITCGAGETAETEGPADMARIETTASDSTNGKKGVSLGMFTTTGYCNCEKCSGGHNLTYSGTVPQAAHTISADLSIYPIGTKLMIDDVIYTVEDMGSSVNGNWIDIYYSSHDEAVAHGMNTQEVFTVVE